jgi:dipeptidyl aminopeptidase/acylaminoacyl peptidase
MIERLATLPAVGEDYRPFALSPDGATVAFTWYRDGDWQVFLLDLEGGGAPRPAAALPDSCECPLFSADGRFLYFSRDDKGSERYDVYRLEIAGGELTNLLPDTPDLSPLPDFDLSPDGRTLALAVDHGDSYAAALLPADGAPGAGGLRILSDHYFNDWTPRFSPDGRYVAYQTDTHGQDSAVFVHDLQTGAHQVIGGEEEPLLAFLALAGSVWSPDGRCLAFHGGPFDHHSIGVYDVERHTTAWVWAGECDAHHPGWSPDGTGLAFLLDEGVQTSLWYVDLVSQQPRCLNGQPGNHYAPVFAADGSSVFVCHSAPQRPTELLQIDLDDHCRLRQLTDGMPHDLKHHPFVSGELVRFTSRDHLAQVPGLLCIPHEPNGAAVVMVHGGPTWHHSNEWDALRQAFLAAGVTTLSPNFRGSDGYGRSWQLANRYMMGYGDLWDSVAGWDFLVESGCDPERIAVTGRSYGGFMTMACLTYYPDLWACGVAGVPFFDWIDAQRDPAIRQDLVWWDRENSGDPEKDRDRFIDRSPYYHLDRITAPVLLLAGENDPRCPPTQVGEVVRQLSGRGVECESVVYPGEGHGITRFDHRLDYDKRTVEFILRHLGAS